MKLTTRTTLRFVGIAATAALVIGLIALFGEHLHIEQLKHLILRSGLLGPVLFILIYLIATLLFVPGTLLTLLGGLIFGPIYGVLFSLTGAVLSAICAFLIARYVAFDWVNKHTPHKVAVIVDNVATNNWHMFAILRLVPMMPFNVLNYAIGLTKIRLRLYISVSIIFMLPGCIAYTYLGYLGEQAASKQEGLIQKGLIGLAMIAILVYLPIAFRRYLKTSAK